VDFVYDFGGRGREGMVTWVEAVKGARIQCLSYNCFFNRLHRKTMRLPCTGWR